jgi:ABC-2 type transport system permease protein
MTAAGASAGGSAGASAQAAPDASGIYDLGYQRYHGPRLGRRHAVRTLYRDALRASFGLGRPGRAKVVPFALAGLTAIPAIVTLGVVALANRFGAGGAVDQLSPIRFATYYTFVGQLLFLFCAAQGPELLGRDQRHSVLTLYFSRSIRRADYALAKLAALASALLLVQLFPQVILFVGRALAAADPLAAAARDAGLLPAVVAQACLAAAVLTTVALAIAGYTPRRSYATAAIIAAYVIPPIVAELVEHAAGGDIARYLAMASVPDLLEAANAWFFGSAPPDGSIGQLPGAFVVAFGVTVVLAAAALLVRRYRRIDA